LKFSAGVDLNVDTVNFFSTTFVIVIANNAVSLSIDPNIVYKIRKKFYKIAFIASILKGEFG
jgi:hypothetical protein